MEGKLDPRPAFRRLEGEMPFGALPTPAYVIEEAQLRENAELLASVMHLHGQEGRQGQDLLYL